MIAEPGTPIYGVMAEFSTEHALMEAAVEAREAGYTSMDAYSPLPIEGISEVLGHPRSWVPVIVLIFGLIGGTTGLLMQYWVLVKAYPLNVGGRPLASWPAFVPITFELTILFAGLAAAIGMFALNKLPEPYHPVFNVPNFQYASQDRFFLVIESTDPRFDPQTARAFLEGLHPNEVSDVPY